MIVLYKILKKITFSVVVFLSMLVCISCLKNMTPEERRIYWERVNQSLNSLNQCSYGIRTIAGYTRCINYKVYRQGDDWKQQTRCAEHKNTYRFP